MVNLPPVGGLIPARDEPNERGAIHKIDGLVTGGVTDGVQPLFIQC